MRALGLAIVGLCAVAQVASANQVVHATINGKKHDITLPDGWTASLQEGGVIIGPPPGRAPSVGLLLSGVARQPTFRDLNKVIDTFIDEEIKKHPGAVRDAIQPRDFVGQKGVTGSVMYDDDEKKKVMVAYATAFTEDTLYLLRANGEVDDVAKVRDEINVIVDGVSIVAEGGAATPPAAWVHEAPLPAGPDGQALITDDMLGVVVGPLPGWGVSNTINSYLLERRFGETHRLVVSIYTSDVSFEGNGEQYLDEVARKQKYAYRWDRFAKRQTLIVSKPPVMDGAGDLLEYHVMRAGRPLIFQFRLDGGRWGAAAVRDAEAARAELESFIHVDEPPPPGKSVPIASLVTVTTPKGWTLDHYGPGTVAVWIGPEGLQAIVGVTQVAIDFSCADGAKAEVKDGTYTRGAKEYRCQGRGVQLLHEIPRGKSFVYVAFGAPANSEVRLKEKDAALFMKTLRMKN